MDMTNDITTNKLLEIYSTNILQNGQLCIIISLFLLSVLILIKVISVKNNS